MKNLFLSLFILLISASTLCAEESIIEFCIAHSDKKPHTKVVIDKDIGKLYSEIKPFMTLSDIEKVNLIVDESKPPVWLEQAFKSTGSTYTTPQISLEVILKDSGKKIFAQVTSENINKRTAVFIEGEYVIAPIIIGKIDSYRVRILWGSNEKKAKEIVDKINKSLNKT